jgi:hypothetical protein
MECAFTKGQNQSGLPLANTLESSSVLLAPALPLLLRIGVKRLTIRAVGVREELGNVINNLNVMRCI